MTSQTKRIIIGGIAGHHFNGQADMTLAYHCWQGDRKGYFVKRKWLADRAAYNYDPRLGWAYEHWFEWDKQPPAE